ncbi:protein-glutamine gamma-glutamyltransferase [Bacillus songklensis]|uniref:Protein-glutamine gamma-glutamyltransferase n=1 Tax=Bacillus songklensis TaxID=1069116 RepID=A0ABV8B7Z1_9BACI
MIKINQKLIEVSQIGYGISSSEKSKILELMGKYSKVYEYETMEQLEFELEIRLQIIRAAVLLYKSGVKFATFSRSKCNEKYWRLTEKGAFVLKPNVLPQTAIEDIFLNGSKYAFECATAIVIIFYKAVLESIDKEQFNRLFSGLYLYDWQYDQDLDLRTHEGTDFLPGDCVYFKNPEYDPKTPQWQGENAIILDENLYYGHGIGITTRQVIINFLNTKRKKNSNKSAYLTHRITRLNVNYLSQFRLKTFRENSLICQHVCHFSNLIISEIGSNTYLL